jgi:hypothetical protein
VCGACSCLTQLPEYDYSNCLVVVTSVDVYRYVRNIKSRVKFRSFLCSWRSRQSYVSNLELRPRVLCTMADVMLMEQHDKAIPWKIEKE